MSRPAGPRDAPVWWCVLGVLPAIFAAGLLLWHEDVIDRSSLKQVSARLTAFGYPRIGRAGEPGLRLFLDDKADGDKLYVAEQKVPQSRLPALRTLRVGDRVTVLLRTYELPANSALWEVRRGAEVLLSYDQTRLGLEREAHTMLFLATFAAAAGLVNRRLAGGWW